MNWLIQLYRSSKYRLTTLSIFELSGCNLYTHAYKQLESNILVDTLHIFKHVSFISDSSSRTVGAPESPTSVLNTLKHSPIAASL